MDPVVTFDVDTGTDEVPVWLTGDWHLGHDRCDLESLLAHVERARQLGARVIHLGDGPEQVGATDRVTRSGALWSQQIPPEPQRQMFAELMAGLAVDVLHPGNHELRVYARAGLDYTESVVDRILAVRQQAGLPHRPVVPLFRPGYVVYRISDRLRYVVYVYHGEGPIVNPFTAHGRLAMDRHGVDIYALGHSHQLAALLVNVQTPDGSRPVWWLRCGHYLRGPDYAVRRKLGPEGQVGSVCAWLHTRIPQVRVEVWPGS
ncbi:MAG: hypothetical protein QN183_13735 [Armatimonadota bacterium]|nr:hypothetical protein [Armatimonadota bacterium]